MKELTDLLAQLVEIDSVNPSLVPGGAGELAIARFVAGWLEKAGLETTIEEIAPGRFNVIAIARGQGQDGGKSRSLLLNAHLDTVGTGNMQNPLKAEISGGRLYGRGALDTKGGLAAYMLAAAQAKKLNLPGDIILAAVADEEFASLGTEALVARWQADAALVAEPTNLEIVSTHKGFVWIEIETFGLAAHGSRPQAGVDAIAKMGKVLVEIEKLGGKLALKPPHPLLGTPSIHASLITGGQEWSTYPDRCHLSVERRTLPGETDAIVKAEIAGIIAGLSEADPDFKASYKLTFSREPLEVDPRSPILQSIVAQSNLLTGAANVVGFSGWTDAALLNAANIPALVFGPKGEGLHGAIEWVDLESVEKCCEVVLAIAIDFCV
ncbi:MAG: ArgE/DapE family deacylase [Chloroflexi bacterium]|nr:ArgE/DapE family deacylase [Chloroflexota bacterium]OJV92179.1 MAG: acetylornithine deacetylase [Chloroflexi bacterium 54-19]